jgi:hypothetical protein
MADNAGVFVSRHKPQVIDWRAQLAELDRARAEEARVQEESRERLRQFHAQEIPQHVHTLIYNDMQALSRRLDAIEAAVRHVTEVLDAVTEQPSSSTRSRWPRRS